MYHVQMNLSVEMGVEMSIMLKKFPHKYSVEEFLSLNKQNQQNV